MSDNNTISLPSDATESQVAEIKKMISTLPVSDILSGLRFAHNRRTAKEAGALRVGRKSKIQKEVHAVSAEQARWRLDNWKKMIADYRRKGYSYPSISRIKKLLTEKAAEIEESK